MQHTSLLIFGTISTHVSLKFRPDNVPFFPPSVSNLYSGQLPPPDNFLIFGSRAGGQRVPPALAQRVLEHELHWRGENNAKKNPLKPCAILRALHGKEKSKIASSPSSLSLTTGTHSRCPGKRNLPQRLFSSLWIVVTRLYAFSFKAWQ